MEQVNEINSKQNKSLSHLAWRYIRLVKDGGFTSYK